VWRLDDLVDHLAHRHLDHLANALLDYLFDILYPRNLHDLRDVLSTIHFHILYLVNFLSHYLFNILYRRNLHDLRDILYPRNRSFEGICVLGKCIKQKETKGKGGEKQMLIKFCGLGQFTLVWLNFPELDPSNDLLSADCLDHH